MCALGTTRVPSTSVGTRLLLQQVLAKDAPNQDCALVSRAGNTQGSADPPALCSLLNMWEIAKDNETNPEEQCDTCGHRTRTFANTWHGHHEQRGAGASTMPTRTALHMPVAANTGDTVLALRAYHKPAAWLFTAAGPLGHPITDSDLEDNIEWTEGRCPSCRRWLMTAIASRPIPAGHLLRGPEAPELLRTSRDNAPSFLISFDGGARHKSPQSSLPDSGPRAAGAGAALWGPINSRGLRQCVAQATIACPRLTDSLSAEAAGLRLGIALIAKVLPQVNSIGIVGDNLPVMRLGAGNGKIRTPGIWEMLEAPLLHIAVRGWQCQWFAVRRRYNKTADALATIGTYQAVDRAAGGLWEPSIQLWTANSEVQDARPFIWHSNWEILQSSAELSLVGLPDAVRLPETCT